MKIKSRLTTLQGSVMEDCLKFLVQEIDGKDLPFPWYCHIENLKALQYCIAKKLFTTEKKQITVPVDHNTIYSLYQVGLSYGSTIDVLSTCIINDLMETAGKKKELQYKKQLALR